MFDQLFTLVQQHCKHGEAVADDTVTPKAIKIPVDDLHDVCLMLFQHTSSYFDMLSCITGIDNGVDAGTMEVVYNLYSIPFNQQLTLKVILPRENPQVVSVVDIWKTADWHEREIYDMFGIKFTGHPDLRRILLPADWEGHPLRKDYKHQDYYRDIKIDY